PPRAVAVDAHDASPRKARLQRLLDALRAATQGFEIHVAAGRAGARHGGLRAAVVTAQAAVDRVQHHARRTTCAGGGPSAGLAREHRRVAPAVDEDEALLAELAPPAHGRQKRARE